MNFLLWFRSLFACPECEGKGGFQTSQGWVKCWRCIRNGKVKMQ